MEIHPLPATYSADVRLQLVVGAHVIPLAQIGPTGIVLREPAELPPTSAEIVMTVDGRERRWTVYLPHGVSPTSLVVPTL